MIRFKLKERIADKEFREDRRITLLEVAEATGSSRAQVQAAIDRAAGKWAKNSWMTALRDEVAAYLQRRESIASVAEVASGLLIAWAGGALERKVRILR